MHTSAVSSGQQTNNKINIVEIEKRNHGFGFNIVGGVDNNYLPGESGIFISRINEDSVAATRNVGLKKGDRIVSVNGQSFADLFHGEAVSILRSIPAQHRACMLVESAAERNIIYDHKNTITSLEVSKADMDDDMKVDQTTVDKVEDEAAENVGDSLENETEPIISAELVIEQTTEDPNSDSIHNLLLSRQANVNGTQPAMSDEVSVEEMVDSLYAELMADLVPQAVDDIDDLPPTPKRPFLSSIMDPKSPPSILTEILFVSFGLAAITLGSLIIYRYYKR